MTSRITKIGTPEWEARALKAATPALRLRQLIKFAKVAPWSVLGYIVLGVFSGLTETLGIALLVPAIDALSGGGTPFARVPILAGIANLFEGYPLNERLVLIASFVAAAVVLRGFLAWWVDVISYSIPIKIEQNLRLKILASMQRAQQSVVDVLPVERIGTLSIEYPARIGIAMRFACMFTVSLAISLILISFLVLISPGVSLLALAAVVVIAIAQRALTQGFVQAVSTDLTSAKETFNRLFYEMIYGGADARIYGAQDRAFRRKSVASENLMRTNYKNLMLELMSYPFVSTFIGLGICGALLWLSTVSTDQLAGYVAPLAIFVGLAMRLIGPMTMINICRHHFAVHERTFDAFEHYLGALNAAGEPHGKKSVADFDGTLDLKEASFRYPDAKVDALAKASFQIKAGEQIAIVGPSGGGKSTLAKLLAGLYLPSNGDVQFSGVSVRDIDLADLRKRISIVTQNSYIQSGTMLDVVSLSDEPDMARIEIAAEQAGIDFIDNQPDGWMTYTDSHGGKLSAGQKQRLLLCRAFYHGGSILVFDEALNNLDTFSRDKVLKSISDLRGKTSVLLVTHEISIAMQADRVIVVSGGQVVEHGRPDELIKSDGMFAALAK
jgi:ABC-type multidrug transport system fused ATPase/permease subunit